MNHRVDIGILCCAVALISMVLAQPVQADTITMTTTWDASLKPSTGQVISNTATTVLIAPIAFSLAIRLGYQPQAFLMLVAIAASTAFASPVASPVNTLVMGSGNYRFSDYLKVGIPLILISMFITIFLLPLLWPMH